MPVKQIFHCDPCNFEYEHLSFGTKWDKAVPPCSICGNTLTYEEPEVTQEKIYRCSGGCGAEIEKEVPFYSPNLVGAKTPPSNTTVCPHCGKDAFLAAEFPSIGHSNSANASIDVVIGRDAEKKWERIYERKAIRDKIRQGAGAQALKATGMNEYQPIKGGHLKAVTTPENTVNRD